MKESADNEQKTTRNVISKNLGGVSDAVIGQYYLQLNNKSV